MTASGADRRRLVGRVLVPGAAQGRVLLLPEPLSLWGGLAAESGEIIDRRHPRSGASVSGRVLVLPSGRGSSSSSSILLEAVRLGTAPAAILMREGDGILALGAMVALELYNAAPPIVVLSSEDYAQLEENQNVRVLDSGEVVIDLQ